MKNNRMKNALENITRRGVPENTNLWPRIESRLDERKSIMKIIRTRPLVAIMLAIFFLLIASGIVYAIGRSLGFSPATGIVETSSLRMLAEPVILERDGFRVTVNEAAVDSAHTTIRYQVEWLNPPPTSGDYDSNCQGTPTLMSSDGAVIGEGVAAANGKGALENGYWYRMEFPALPAGQNDVKFIIPCLLPLIPGSLPQDWEFDLRFTPWDGTPLAPVYEVPTATVASTTEVKQPTQAIKNYEISFALEQVIELDNGYVFEGSANWTDPNIQSYSVSPYSAHLTDATGRVIPLEWAPPQSTPAAATQTRWAFQSTEKPSAFPLTLIVDGYTFTLNTQTAFQLDLGSNPQAGQTWTLNLDIPVENHILRIDSATWVNDPNAKMLEFNLSSDEGVFGAGLYDLQNTLGQGGGGGAGEPPPGPFVATIYYENDFPSGVIQISIVSLEIVVRETWQAIWQP